MTLAASEGATDQLVNPTPTSPAARIGTCSHHAGAVAAAQSKLHCDVIVIARPGCRRRPIGGSMRRILAWVVLSAFLSGAISASPQGLAQVNGPEEQTAEFAQLFKGRYQAQDLTDQIVLAERALKAGARSTPLAFPGGEGGGADWANTQNSLGVTYQHRTRGDRADNMEKAIASFEQALTIFTQESEPLNWV
jgi:hypothetical protein